MNQGYVNGIFAPVSSLEALMVLHLPIDSEHLPCPLLCPSHGFWPPANGTSVSSVSGNFSRGLHFSFEILCRCVPLCVGLPHLMAMKYISA